MDIIHGVGPRAIDEEKWKSVMVDCLIELTRDLGVVVTAEGVETVAQLRNLQGLGCDVAQGYLLGKPMRGEDVAAFLADLRAGSQDALLNG